MLITKSQFARLNARRRERVGRKWKGDNGGIAGFCTSCVREPDGSQDPRNWYSNWSPRGQHPSPYLWLLPWQRGACAVLSGRLGQPEPCGEQSRGGRGGPWPPRAAAGLGPGCATCAEAALPPRLPKSRVVSCRVYLSLGRQAVILTRVV